jgi:hypothetical protein
MWRIRTEQRVNAIPVEKPLTNKQLLWDDEYGTEVPHDLQTAIDTYNTSTTRTRLELDASSGRLECRAIVYTEAKEEPPIMREPGKFYCDNCDKVLTEATRLPRWDCTCAWICSEECRDIARHRTGNCDCRGLGECRPQFEQWRAKHPGPLPAPSYDCRCDNE